MSKEHYQQTITVNASPAEVYQALTTGYDHWWTATQGKTFQQVGDNIAFTFPPNVSNWTLQAKSLTPNLQVILECVEAHHVIIDKPGSSETEWLGTTMTWDICSDGDKTIIDFSHQGLVPQLACYDVCSAGWDHFFVDSLQAYLNNGKGHPHRAEAA